MGVLERIERWTFDSPVPSTLFMFGGLAVLDAMILGLSPMSQSASRCFNFGDTAARTATSGAAASNRSTVGKSQ